MSRLCRLKTDSHGEDGLWAYGEIVRLREENTLLKKHCTAVPAPNSLDMPKQINKTDFSAWGIVCDE